jgi:hypothetical protein
MGIGSTVEVVPTNQIIAILNNDSIDVKLLKVADKFRAVDSNLTRCMILRLYILRAIVYCALHVERKNDMNFYDSIR